MIEPSNAHELVGIASTDEQARPNLYQLRGTPINHDEWASRTDLRGGQDIERTIGQSEVQGLTEQLPAGYYTALPTKKQGRSSMVRQ